MSMMRTIRDRSRAVFAAVAASVILCCCGATLAFYLSPRQALEARRIADLPQMDAAFIESAEAGDPILVSGALSGNPQLLEDYDFVAYRLEEWQVQPPDPETESESTSGDWVTLAKDIPVLTIQVTGAAVTVQVSPDVLLAGPLRTIVLPGEGPETAYDGSEELAEGTQRYSGFYDGDLITVLGAKASVGGIVPEKLFAGDRVQFEQYERDTAKGLLIGGIVLMVLAPVVLIGGGLAAVFGKRRMIS